MVRQFPGPTCPFSQAQMGDGCRQPRGKALDCPCPGRMAEHPLNPYSWGLVHPHLAEAAAQLSPEAGAGPACPHLQAAGGLLPLLATEWPGGDSPSWASDPLWETSGPYLHTHDARSPGRPTTLGGLRGVCAFTRQPWEVGASLQSAADGQGPPQPLAAPELLGGCGPPVRHGRS